MIYSRTAKYGIKALKYMAENTDGNYKTVEVVAEDTDIPPDFLGKIFQDMVKENFLQSRRGRGGGFRLAMDQKEISLLDIVKAIDGEEALNRCLFDTKQCGENGTCPLHDDWVPLRKKLEKLLREKTIYDLAEV